MRTYKTKEQEVVTREIEYLYAKTCDLCGKNDNGGSVHSDSDWADSKFDFDIIHVRRIHGSSFPTGDGNKCREYFDICPDCFNNKLVKWLESQGASIQTHEIEY